MKTYYDCLPCLITQALEAIRHTSEDESVHEELLRRVLSLMAEGDFTDPTPVFIGSLHRMVREISGNSDPYRDAKQRLNTAALDHYPRFKSIVENSDDPLESAVRMAIAGNIIDFVVNARADQTDLALVVGRALNSPLVNGVMDEFRQAVHDAETILYLGDNAGEIVLDKLLIEQISADKVTYVVKGGPVVNDITMEDARFTGMTELVEVADNGSDMAGTVLEYCSDDFRQRFEEADLVISKGQGNYESLSEVDKDIFFLLQTKCHVLTLDLGIQAGSMVLKRSRQHS